MLNGSPPAFLARYVHVSSNVLTCERTFSAVALPLGMLLNACADSQCDSDFRMALGLMLRACVFLVYILLPFGDDNFANSFASNSLRCTPAVQSHISCTHVQATGIYIFKDPIRQIALQDKHKMELLEQRKYDLSCADQRVPVQAHTTSTTPYRTLMPFSEQLLALLLQTVHALKTPQSLRL